MLVLHRAEREEAEAEAEEGDRLPARTVLTCLGYHTQRETCIQNVFGSCNAQSLRAFIEPLHGIKIGRHLNLVLCRTFARPKVNLTMRTFYLCVSSLWSSLCEDCKSKRTVSLCRVVLCTGNSHCQLLKDAWQTLIWANKCENIVCEVW